MIEILTGVITMILMLFLGVLIVLLLIGVAVPYAIGLTSFIVLIIERGIASLPYEIIAQRLVYGMNNFTLLAIPFFLLAGKLMNTGSITQRIFHFANKLVGFMPGGLGHANVVASMIFAGMSGSAVADAAGLGTIEVKAMIDQGYDREFAAAVTAASSTIGPIIPPSIPLIMFGVMGDVSISALLIGGFIPGVLMGVSLMIMVYFYAKKRKYPYEKFPSLAEFWQAFRSAFFPLLTPFILIGGIISGVFTPTEASAIAVLYAFILSTFYYKELTLKQFFSILVDTIKESSIILFIVGISSLYGWLLIKTQIPNYLMEKVFLISHNPLVILMILNVFFFIVGMFMESIAAITILTPVIIPMAIKVGIDPLHLGLVMVLNLMIGLLTPPIGMCLYAVARVSELPFDRTLRAVIPFYIPLIVVLLLLTFVPQIGTFLPSILLLR